MGIMEIMGKEGDVKLEWDPDKSTEVEVAKKTFKENLAKGFKAFRMYDGGKKGEQISEFDKFAERLLFVVPLAGG
jgi:hypothetical protein